MQGLLCDLRKKLKKDDPAPPPPREQVRRVKERTTALPKEAEPGRLSLPSTVRSVHIL